jgi:hypothetical protein
MGYVLLLLVLVLNSGTSAEEPIPGQAPEKLRCLPCSLQPHLVMSGSPRPGRFPAWACGVCYWLAAPKDR